MITFFKDKEFAIYAVKSGVTLDEQTVNKLTWLFGEALKVDGNRLTGGFIGPRKEMITPWSTNAVEITQNMGINGIERIEMFLKADQKDGFDVMLQAFYEVT